MGLSRERDRHDRANNRLKDSRIRMQEQTKGWIDVDKKRNIRIQEQTEGQREIRMTLFLDVFHGKEGKCCLLTGHCAKDITFSHSCLGYQIL